MLGVLMASIDFCASTFAVSDFCNHEAGETLAVTVFTAPLTWRTLENENFTSAALFYNLQFSLLPNRVFQHR
jgi:hypothetical protein